jgi:polyisoprenoid-binding protein YceI
MSGFTVRRGDAAAGGFHASTAVRRADFGMKRDLLAEIGSSTVPDVTIEIDAQATMTSAES